MDDLSLHQRFIGQQGARRRLNTPILVIDHDALSANIEAMAAFARRARLELRPHAKTHKSNAIARLQIAAGAVGICCAKIGEAEALAEGGGVDSIHITSPVVGVEAVERVAALHAALPDLRVVIDHPENAEALAGAVEGAARPLNVLIDIDPGLKRTGVASPEAARELAARIMDLPALSLIGVQYYCGREQHVASFAERETAIRTRTEYLQRCLAAISGVAPSAKIVTGGGTGTFAIDAALGVLTELQVGSYIFMDRQYLECELSGAGAPTFKLSLIVDSRIVSANTPGMATVDAGLKAFSTDGDRPLVQTGAPEGAEYYFMGDEHGAVHAKEARFALGDIVTLMTPHCDPTVNLYDFYHVVRGDTLIDIWPISARGRSR